MKKIYFFLIINLFVLDAFSRCPSFSQMVERLEGVQQGTPISVKTVKGEKIEGTVEQVLIDPNSGSTYLVFRNNQGQYVSRWLKDLNPSTLNAPIDNVIEDSFIRFRSKSGNTYEGRILDRRTIDGEDTFLFEMDNGMTSRIRVSRVNENSVQVLDQPMPRLYLDGNELRQGQEITSGDFISVEVGNARMPARVTEIRTGLGGEKVSLEILSSEGALVKVDVRGDQLSTLRLSSSSRQQFEIFHPTSLSRGPPRITPKQDGYAYHLVQDMRTHQNVSIITRNTDRRISGTVDKLVGNPRGALNNHIDFREYALGKGLILDGASGTPNNLIPGKKYTYIIREDGTMAFGQVDNTWEVGVKHMHLAGDDKVVAAGEVIRNVDGSVTFNLESGTFTRKIKQYSNPNNNPDIDIQTDTYLGDRVQRIFDNEVGPGKSIRTEESLFKDLKNPSPEDLLEYCKNPTFRKFNGVDPQGIKDKFGRDAFVFPTHWCP
jgi:hypothetical protein